MDTPILIFGTQTKARLALDIFQAHNVLVYGLLHAQPTPPTTTTYNHVSILGHIEDDTYLQLLGEKCHPFVALEDLPTSQRTIAQLAEADKLQPLNAIHPFVHISQEARLGVGNIVHAASTIDSQATLHNYCTLLGHNMVGHNATLHNFVTLGAGALVHPHATIHRQATIGSGAIIQPHVTIGAGASIPPRTLVSEDVPPAIELAQPNPTHPIDHA